MKHFGMPAALLAALILAGGAQAEITPAATETPTPLGVRIRWTPSPAPKESAEELPGSVMSGVIDGDGALGSRVLMRGMEGGDVLQLQRRLIELGYLWDEADGRYGRQTAAAVEDFQRANGLEKVDGKAGEETVARLFGEDIVPHPTPSPSPTPVPPPTPTPSPTPTPMPASTRAPSAAGAPFAAETRAVFIEENPVTLLIGSDEGRALYPLCGVLMHRGYSCIASGGVWEMTAPDGRRITLMAGEESGRADGVMGALGSELFIAEEPVYVYCDDVWAPAAMLSRLGLHIVETGGTAVIW